MDGTLIRSRGANANKLHKEAFAAAFRDVFSLETTIDVVPHHGCTDGLILIMVLQHHGVAYEDAMAKLPQMQQTMVDHFLANAAAAGEGLEVLPGVAELLRTLRQRDDAVSCLVTGNLQPIAWAKMEALGIKDLFTAPFGGFGSDFCSGNADGMGWRDRAELVRIAARRAEELGHGPLGLRVHVGDAPMDVKAAVAAGARPLGLTTGIYLLEELEGAAEGVTVLDGLHDLDRVLEVLDLQR